MMDKILLVDDMQQSVDLTTHYLTHAGYEVISANNGPIAIKKAKMFKPDLILLDLLMPQMSGFEVCKILKEDEETKYILIMIITAMDSEDSRSRAFEIGADDFISKSYDRALLLSKIKSLLRIKHLSNQLKQQYAEIQEKNKIMDFQMNVAMQVQRSLIEDFNFNVNHVNFFSRYLPALGIGGDMYDIVELENNRVALIIGDVSGHGISAALLTSMLKMIFRNTLKLTTNPSDVLAKMNMDFCNIFSTKLIDVYFCAFFAIIDTEKKSMSYSNAGHALPIYMNYNQGTALELDANGIPIGMMEDYTYESKTLNVADGDIVLFHTDGLCDSFYKDNSDEFVQKLKDLLTSSKDLPAKKLTSYILDQFQNNDEAAKYNADDISLIICKM